MSSPLPTAHGLDPHALLAIRNLELRARVVVEGLWSGLHRSPFAGFSVEFTEYRQYVPGDDLRHLDWKVLGRTDREYMRKFEDETNLRCHLLVDHSGSMTFGSNGYPKSDYARTIAATLGTFMLQQRDMVGLTVFADGVAEHLPARWRHGHLRRLLAVLERLQPGTRTRLDTTLDEAARLFRKRSLVVLISDLLSPVDEWEGALGRLVAGGHDVRVLQVLDPAELTLEFGRAGQWEDLEDGRRLYLDPARARSAYRTRFAAHQESIHHALARRGVPHQLITTDQPLDLALLEWLQRHKRHARLHPRVRRAPA
jgi:uncharacterized protein (DUF58 family)